MVFSVSTLVTLASIPGDKPPFGKLLKEQIHDLRKQLDRDEPGGDQVAAKLANVATRASLRPTPSVPHNKRDVRVLSDALNDHISPDDPRQKIYSTPQHPESQQLDADAQRVRTLLDSLSESVANMSTSSRVYRPFVAHDVGREAGRKVGTDKVEDESGSSLCDLLDRVCMPLQLDGQGNIASNKTYQRRLPTPPGPPGMGWDQSIFTGPTSSGSFVGPQPARHRRPNFDASDLA